MIINVIDTSQVLDDPLAFPNPSHRTDPRLALCGPFLGWGPSCRT